MQLKDFMSWASIAVNYNVPRGANNERSATEAQTGYCELTLDELYEGAEEHFSHVQRGGRWQPRQRETWRAREYFSIFLMYIHLYPAKDSCVDILRTQRLPGVPYFFCSKRLCPWRAGGPRPSTTCGGTTGTSAHFPAKPLLCAPYPKPDALSTG